MGSEDRQVAKFVPPEKGIMNYVTFKGDQISDIRVEATPAVSDPAIVEAETAPSAPPNNGVKKSSNASIEKKGGSTPASYASAVNRRSDPNPNNYNSSNNNSNSLEQSQKQSRTHAAAEGDNANRRTNGNAGRRGDRGAAHQNTDQRNGRNVEGIPPKRAEAAIPVGVDFDFAASNEAFDKEKFEEETSLDVASYHKSGFFDNLTTEVGERGTASGNRKHDAETFGSAAYERRSGRSGYRRGRGGRGRGGRGSFASRRGGERAAV